MIQQQLIKAEKLNSTLLSEKETIEQKAGKLVYLVLSKLFVVINVFSCVFDLQLCDFYEEYEPKCICGISAIRCGLEIKLRMP
jgi:hypothetical protein